VTIIVSVREITRKERDLEEKRYGWRFVQFDPSIRNQAWKDLQPPPGERMPTAKELFETAERLKKDATSREPETTCIGPCQTRSITNPAELYPFLV
jgi:hypothetical protein